MKQRILLVDDDLAVLLTLKAVLQLNHFEVDTAASAADALRCLKSHTYDLVISDAHMEHEEAGLTEPRRDLSDRELRDVIHKTTLTPLRANHA